MGGEGELRHERDSRLADEGPPGTAETATPFDETRLLLTCEYGRGPMTMNMSPIPG
jgi:hypothetical protein